MIKAKGAEAIRSRFLKDGANIAIGVIASQLIIFSTIPILSRMYDQTEFGIQAPYNTVLIVFAILASLGLNSAIPLPATQKESESIIKLQFLVGITTSIFLMILITAGSYLFGIDLFEKLFKSGFDIVLFFIIIIGIILTVYVNSVEVRLIQLNKTLKVSVGKILKAVAMVLTAIVIFYLPATNSMALIYASFGSWIVLAIFYFFQYKINFLSTSGEELKAVAVKYKKFIQYTLPNSLLNSVSFNIPNFLLIALYTEQAAGNYAMAFRLVSLPTLFFTSSLRNVFLTRVAAMTRDSPEQLYPFVKKVLFGLHGISFLVYLTVIFLSDWVVPFYLGDDWVEAIFYIKILSIWQFMLIANSTMSGLLQVLDRQDSAFYYEVLLFIGRVLSLSIPFYMGASGEMAVLYYSLVGFVFNGYLSYFYLSTGKKYSLKN
ncbi:MAG: oligosaccharide flippase family protein [Cyclobacteriaceae bacterium]